MTEREVPSKDLYLKEFSILEKQLSKLESEIQTNTNKLTETMEESTRIQVKFSHSPKIIKDSKQNLIECQTLFRQMNTISKKNKKEILQKVRKFY
jgi:predicted  nucleic acid-binding Zn-ribbon protein